MDVLDGFRPEAFLLPKNARTDIPEFRQPVASNRHVNQADLSGAMAIPLAKIHLRKARPEHGDRIGG